MTAAAAYAVAGDVVPAPGGRYSEAVVGAPRHLNPLLARPGSPDDDVCALVFAGLTRLDAAHRVVGDLAVDWTVSPDGLRYEFRLRDDASFQDGASVRAEDVVATVQAIQARDFAGDPELRALWSGIAAVADGNRVRFTLPAPNGWFLEQAAIGILPARLIVPGAALLEADMNQRPVGAGPFKVVAANLRRIELAASATYWDRAPFIRSIELRFVPDAASAAAMLGRGEVTAVRPLGQRELSQLPAGAIGYVRPELGKSYRLIFNTRVAPFDDPALRAALFGGLDRSRIATAAGSAMIAAAGSADLPGAREALARAGWRAGADGTIEKDGRALRIAIVASDTPAHVAIAEEVARQLGALGARPEVQRVGWTGMLADVLVPGRFQLAIVEAFDPSREPDPARFWASGAPLNVGGWRSRRADEALAAARRASTPAGRLAALGDFQAAFDAEAPGIMLGNPAIVFAVSSELRGVTLAPLVAPRDRFATFADWYLLTRRAPGRF